MTTPLSGGSTPVYGLKYIVQGQPARDTRRYLQENAESIEAALIRGGIAPPAAQDLATLAGRVTTLEGSPPVALTPATGFSAFGSGYQAPRAWRIQSTVFLSGLFLCSTSLSAGGGSAVVTTLPAGLRPAAAAGTVAIPTFAGGGTVAPIGRFDIGSDGKVTLVAIQAMSTGQYVPLAGSFSVL